MGNRLLSTDVKTWATELLNDGWTEVETAEVLGISVSLQ